MGVTSASETDYLPEHQILMGSCCSICNLCVVFCRSLFTLKSFFFWPLHCLTFDLQLLFISSVSCGHCIVQPSLCSFYLSRRYIVAIVLSDLRFVPTLYLVGFFVAFVLSELRFVASIYLVGILWPLYCLTFDLQLLFISSVSCGHCIV